MADLNVFLSYPFDDTTVGRFVHTVHYFLSKQPGSQHFTGPHRDRAVPGGSNWKTTFEHPIPWLYLRARQPEAHRSGN
jgi:hypothetical protein